MSSKKILVVSRPLTEDQERKYSREKRNYTPNEEERQKFAEERRGIMRREAIKRERFRKVRKQVLKDRGELPLPFMAFKKSIEQDKEQIQNAFSAARKANNPNERSTYKNITVTEDRLYDDSITPTLVERDLSFKSTTKDQIPYLQTLMENQVAKTNYFNRNMGFRREIRGWTPRDRNLLNNMPNMEYSQEKFALLDAIKKDELDEPPPTFTHIIRQRTMPNTEVVLETRTERPGAELNLFEDDD